MDAVDLIEADIVRAIDVVVDEYLALLVQLAVAAFTRGYTGHNRRRARGLHKEYLCVCYGHFRGYAGIVAIAEHSDDAGYDDRALGVDDGLMSRYLGVDDGIMILASYPRDVNVLIALKL